MQNENKKLKKNIKQKKGKSFVKAADALETSALVSIWPYQRQLNNSSSSGRHRHRICGLVTIRNHLIFYPSLQLCCTCGTDAEESSYSTSAVQINSPFLSIKWPSQRRTSLSTRKSDIAESGKFSLFSEYLMVNIFSISYPASVLLILTFLIFARLRHGSAPHSRRLRTLRTFGPSEFTGIISLPYKVVKW